MFIDNRNYATPDLAEAVNIRNLLFTHFYNYPEMIASMEETIKSCVQVDSIAFDPATYSFMFKIHSLVGTSDLNDVRNYYPMVQNIYATYFDKHKPFVMKVLLNHCANPYEIIGKIYNQSILLMACNITVLDPNTVVIKL